MGLWSVKNQWYQIWNYYISLDSKFNAEQFFTKEVHAERRYFQVYLRKTIPNHTKTIKYTCQGQINTFVIGKPKFSFKQ